MTTNANPWTRLTWPFRQMMHQFSRPAAGPLGMMDEVDTWCANLTDFQLPALLTINSPLAALPQSMITSAGSEDSPVWHSTPSAGNSAQPQRMTADRFTPTEHNRHQPPKFRTDTPSGTAGHPRATPVEELSAPGFGAGTILPIRRSTNRAPVDKVTGTHAPASASVRSESEPLPRRLSPSDLSSPSPSPGDTGRHAIASTRDDTPNVPDKDNRLQLTEADRSHSKAASRLRSDPELAELDGPRLLAVLTKRLYSRHLGLPEPEMTTRVSMADRNTTPLIAGDTARTQLVGSNRAVPRAPDNGHAASATMPVPESARVAARGTSPAMRTSNWSVHANTPQMAFDPDQLAELVNEALVEQARRHGALLP